MNSLPNIVAIVASFLVLFFLNYVFYGIVAAEFFENHAGSATGVQKEEVDMIKAGKLRPLAVLADAPLKIDGYDQEIPSVKKWIPDFVTAPIYFGIFVPKGVPQEAVDTLTMIWDKSLKNNEGLQTFAAKNAMIFDPATGDTAMQKAFPMVQLDAWLKFDSGDAAIDPSTIGIPRP